MIGRRLRLDNKSNSGKINGEAKEKNVRKRSLRTRIAANFWSKSEKESEGQKRESFSGLKSDFSSIFRLKRISEDYDQKEPSFVVRTGSFRTLENPEVSSKPYLSAGKTEPESEFPCYLLQTGCFKWKGR